MASRPQPTASRRSAARLYLVTPLVAEPATYAGPLAAALAAGDIAAVLLRLAAADERTLINRIKEIAPAVQEHGAALLLDGRPELVARSGADGAHLTGTEAVKETIAALKPERIAGVGGLASRHDAMLAAESGADYVMFGEPERDGRRPAFEAVLDRVAWWSEIFQVPCVAYAENLDEVEALAQVGADFVAIGASVWSGGRDAVAAAAKRLSIVEPVQ